MTPRELRATMIALAWALTAVAAIAVAALCATTADRDALLMTGWAVGLACGFGWAVVVSEIARPTDKPRFQPL